MKIKTNFPNKSVKQFGSSRNWKIDELIFDINESNDNKNYSQLYWDSTLSNGHLFFDFSINISYDKFPTYIELCKVDVLFDEETNSLVATHDNIERKLSNVFTDDEINTREVVKLFTEFRNILESKYKDKINIVTKFLQDKYVADFYKDNLKKYAYTFEMVEEYINFINKYKPFFNK